MMVAISRNTFVARLSEGVPVDRMSPELEAALGDAGVSPDELRALAGQDRVIRGEVELGQLFVKLGARAQALEVEDGRGAPTVGGRAFRALEAASRAAEPRADYDRLFESGRLDVTLAVGSAENAHDAERAIVRGLRERGFVPMRAEQIRALPADARRRLGLEDGRLDPGAMILMRPGGDAVLRVVAPAVDGPRVSRSMDRAALVIHTGGIAPRAAAPATGLRSSVPPSDRPDYQLMIIAGRTVDPRLSARDAELITPERSVRPSAEGAQVMALLDGVMARKSHGELMAVHASLERAALVSSGLSAIVVEGASL